MTQDAENQGEEETVALGMTRDQLLAFNAGIVDEFRANGGACGGMFEGNDMILLTMKGAKSGRELVSPLTYHPYEGDFVVMASAGGAPNHPAWYYNLVAHPDITAEVGTERFSATAVLTAGDERQAVYDSMTAAMPRFAEYQAKVEREIPLFRIVRTS
jgi:deazaflavin-dependent oxidoreductase (nitroreductase family)